MRRTAITVYLLTALTIMGCGPSMEQIEERRFRDWVDSDFQKLVTAVENASERIRQEGWNEGTIPKELSYLNPERVFVGERGVVIETYVHIGTSAGLSMHREASGEWIVSLFMNEHDEGEEIWRESD